MNANQKSLLEYLSSFITPERNALYNNVIENRTNYITVVLEDIYQPQNASAVLRTCDCFGIQDVHIIENRNKYEVNPEVELGAAQWLTMHMYNQNESNTLRAITELKKSGYRIVATSPHSKGLKLEDFDITKGRTAVLLGTEISGLSDVALSHADEFITIPMIGFTESFNISVSAGIILHHLSSLLRKSGIDWSLNKDEKEKVILGWIKNSIKNASLIENGFKKRFYT